MLLNNCLARKNNKKYLHILKTLKTFFCTFFYYRLHSMYLSGSHGHQHRSGQESQLVTSVLLERCGDSAVRHSNRIIPVIQEQFHLRLAAYGWLVVTSNLQIKILEFCHFSIYVIGGKG